MTSRLIRMTTLMVFGILLLLGCGADKGEEEAKGFVQNYCSILQDAYSRADMKLIGRISTEKEMKKLFPVIQALTATDNYMKTEILEFKIKKAKVKDDKATVSTSEKWRYWWIDQKTGTITKPKHEESYELEYNLLKVDGSWRVDFIKNLNE
ncbi:MAG: hypothetical protein JJE30_17230 [Desulfuromonadales bacterium]|nr:hypothetical protein [Desulfuromonadales bacterium]